MLKKLLPIIVVMMLLAAYASNGASSSDTTHPDSAGDLTGDPARGRELFTTSHPGADIACSTCHHNDSEERLVGPGLWNVGSRAQSRVEGATAAQYLYDSITDPSAYVVHGYPNIMPKNWATIFSEEELRDIIAYLMTLHE